MPISRHSIRTFFYDQILPIFVNKIRLEITQRKERWEKARQEQEGMPLKKKARVAPKPSMSSSSLYFPERLPKLHTFLCIIRTLGIIVQAIILGPLKHTNETKGYLYGIAVAVHHIFANATDYLTFTDIHLFMYLTIRNGTHYGAALNEVRRGNG